MRGKRGSVHVSENAHPVVVQIFEQIGRMGCGVKTFSGYVGIGSSTFWRWAAGESDPSIRQLEIIGDFLAMDLTWQRKKWLFRDDPRAVAECGMGGTIRQ